MRDNLSESSEDMPDCCAMSVDPGAEVCTGEDVSSRIDGDRGGGRGARGFVVVVVDVVVVIVGCAPPPPILKPGTDIPAFASLREAACVVPPTSGPVDLENRSGERLSVLLEVLAGKLGGGLRAGKVGVFLEGKAGLAVFVLAGKDGL